MAGSSMPRVRRDWDMMSRGSQAAAHQAAAARTATQTDRETASISLAFLGCRQQRAADAGAAEAEIPGIRRPRPRETRDGDM